MENSLIGIEESDTDPFYRVSDQKFVDKARHTLPEVLRIGKLMSLLMMKEFVSMICF